MKFLNRLLVMFAVSNDEDLAAEENFEVSFSNVVNFMLLVYCIISGVHALLIENMGMAISNMIFSILFICYFLSRYITKRSIIITAFDRIIIFAQFIVAYINSSVIGAAGITILIYPFLAIILHGRRLGVTLSIIQLLVIGAYTLLCMTGILPIVFNYTAMDIFVIFSIQAVSIFTYYVAIRWLSSLIYDRITEVWQLNETIGIKTGLIKQLTDDLRSQLQDINKASELLSRERLNVRQTEMIANLKASSVNLIETINSVATASERNIRPIPKEEIVFNIYNLISNVLVLYGSKTEKGRGIHSVKMSSEVPQTLLGNSQLTRKVFLSSFDALDRKFNMSTTPMSVSVTMNDISSEHLVLSFTITSDRQISVDHRDLTSSETKLLYQLQLDSTQRLVIASGGDFTVEISNDDKLKIEFTLAYKDVILKQNNDPEVDDKHVIDISSLRTTNLMDARVLIVNDNSEISQKLSKHLKELVKEIIYAPHSRIGIKMFENSKFDFVFVDMASQNVEGHLLVRSIRDIEIGGGPGVPIFAIEEDEDKEIYLGDLEDKIDGTISCNISQQELKTTLEEMLAIE